MLLGGQNMRDTLAGIKSVHSPNQYFRSRSRFRLIPNPVPARKANARAVSAYPASRPQIPPQKSQKNQHGPRKKASGPTPMVTLLVPNAPSLLHQIMTLAGVAQSVERVALINSKEINLKVVGSSPTFGYSYITSFNMK
jgi:hypothetical protein